MYIVGKSESKNIYRVYMSGGSGVGRYESQRKPKQTRDGGVVRGAAVCEMVATLASVC
jgi:hypothetical protein